MHSAVSEEEELNCLPGRREDDPLFRYLDAEMRQRLTEAINDLPERERLIMTLYYYEETTMTEIGIILGIVESRISQIHASAVLHLRARLCTPVTSGQPQGDQHPNRVSSESFRKGASASKPESRGHAKQPIVGDQRLGHSGRG